MPPPELPGVIQQRCTGTVATFDADAGLGTVVADEDDASGVYGFHCTEIADGTRTIEVGTQVTFVVGPAGPGLWEAKQLRSLNEDRLEAPEAIDGPSTGL